MEIFIVTQSAPYESEPGAGDWQLVTLDEDHARRHFENLDASDSDVYLLAIETDEDETCVPQGEPVHRVVARR